LFNAKKFKQRQAQAWSSVADNYDVSPATLGYPAAVQMLNAAGIKEGDVVLDLASGTGLDAFFAAPMVGESGSIVGVDIAPRMVEVASEKAKARGVKNVTFEVGEAEKLRFKDKTFDVAVCKYGLSYFSEGHQALREVFRVLKPGGHFATLVPGRPEGSQLMTIGARAVFKAAPDLVARDPGGPTEFQYGPEGALAAALNAAGFINVRSWRYAIMITTDTPEKYWTLLINAAANLTLKLSTLDQGVREMVKREVMIAAERYLSPEGIRLPLEVVLGYGEKPIKGKEAAAPSKRKTLDEFLAEEGSTARQIPPQEAARSIRDLAVVFVDVRSQEAYAKSRIPRALGIPRGQLELKMEKMVVPEATKQIVVYSEDGKLGKLAAHTLVELGYRNVTNLEGGIAAWQAAKLPLDTQAKQTQAKMQFKSFAEHTGGNAQDL
jgi:ubiquinone/menaquinone biosynthesis C-methylase UbiE/rhodanese-related sulfurtransferase